MKKQDTLTPPPARLNLYSQSHLIMNPTQVRPKKHLGQHFLFDKNIACKIVNSLTFKDNYNTIIEVGPGKGILTQYLAELEKINLIAVEVDKESVEYLKNTFPHLSENIIYANFLKLDLEKIAGKPFGVIGNFPYNISSQILFKVLHNRMHIPEVVGMFQKEVAERIVAIPHNKTYGILSVLVQVFYNTEYLFTVNETVFHPRPKVKSAVIRLCRKDNLKIGCNEELFFKVVKSAFNQRRKTLSNALKNYIFAEHKSKQSDILSCRAEELSPEQFVQLVNFIESR